MSNDKLVPLGLLAPALGVSYDVVRRRAQRGEIPRAQQDASGAWLVPQSVVERAERHAAGERAAATAAECVPATQPELRDAVARFHRGAIAQEIVLREMRDAALRAAMAGDVELTSLVDGLRDSLRRSRYLWDVTTSTWRITPTAAPPAHATSAAAAGSLTLAGSADVTVSHTPSPSHADQQ